MGDDRLRTVGERLRAARERLKKTQLDIATELDKQQPTVSAWESGRTLPRTEELRAVAKAYGISPARLIPDEAA